MSFDILLLYVFWPSLIDSLVDVKYLGFELADFLIDITNLCIDLLEFFLLLHRPIIYNTNAFYSLQLGVLLFDLSFQRCYLESKFWYFPIFFTGLGYKVFYFSTVELRWSLELFDDELIALDVHTNFLLSCLSSFKLSFKVRYVMFLLANSILIELVTLWMSLMTWLLLIMIFASIIFCSLTSLLAFLIILYFLCVLFEECWTILLMFWKHLFSKAWSPI